MEAKLLTLLENYDRPTNRLRDGQAKSLGSFTSKFQLEIS